MTELREACGGLQGGPGAGQVDHRLVVLLVGLVECVLLLGDLALELGHLGLGGVDLGLCGGRGRRGRAAAAGAEVAEPRTPGALSRGGAGDDRGSGGGGARGPAARRSDRGAPPSTGRSRSDPERAVPMAAVAGQGGHGEPSDAAAPPPVRAVNRSARTEATLTRYSPCPWVEIGESADHHSFLSMSTFVSAAHRSKGR